MGAAMSTRVRHTAGCTLLYFVSFVGLALSACSDDPEAPHIGPSIKVAISPAEVPTLCAGEKTRLQASVTGTSATGVQWRSAALQTATVDSTGLVTAIGEGSTWVFATAVADSTARDSVTIGVAPVLLFYGHTTVWLGAITKHNTSIPIDSTNVSGVVNVLVEHDMPNCWRGLSIRVRLNDQTVCNYGVLQGRGTTLCIVNTAEVNQGGQRRFPNGPGSMRAEVVRSDGVILAISAARIFTLRN